jgi:branched-chain amino acid transport system substrate-binding protein
MSRLTSAAMVTIANQFGAFMKIWRGQFLTALAVSLFLTGCNKPPGDSTTDNDIIKVGEFASLTGKEATFGISSHEGTLLAVEQINAAGGVLGKKSQLLT